MPDLSRTVQRATLLASLRTYPIPTISVDDYALLIGVSRPRAYANVNEGRVEVQRDGRKVQVLVAPLLESMGFPLTPPTLVAGGEPASEAAILGAYAAATGTSTEDVLAITAR